MNVTPPDAYSDGTLFGGVTDWYLEPKDSSEENVVTPSGRVLWFVGSLHCRKPSHSSSVGPSRKRSRSPTTLVPLSSPVPGALSFVCVDLLPPHKRIRSSDSAMDLEDCSDESSKSSLDINPEIQAKINECIAYADALRVEGIVARVVVKTAAQEEVETSARGIAHETLGDMVQRFHDHTIEIPVHRVQIIKSIQRDQGHMIVATGKQSVVQLERIRLMPNTRSGATMTREAVDNLIGRRVAEALEARDAARNLEPLAEGRDEQGGKDGDDYEDGNRGVNGNVIAAEPTRLQEAIHIANNLMDQKLKGYARSAENKRRFDNKPSDNRGQQSAFKRQNVGGQNVTRAYTAGNNEKRETVRGPGHYRKDFPKLRNQNRRNKTGNKTENNEATEKAYAIRGGGANHDSNVVTCTALLDVAPSTLDTSYVIELVDGRISETNIILRGCTGSKSKLNITSCTKTQKYIQKGCQVYLAQVTSKKTEDKSEEKQLEDVPIVREFSEVFLENLLGLPHTRQIEFQINLVLSAAPVARAPYRLAPAEMQELSTQLQELSEQKEL
ncbi:hypothetical protein Tco_0246606 [Tanacetum coccineum]